MNKVQQILVQIEQINSEIKRSSLERLKRSNSSLKSKDRNTIALLNVTNQLDSSLDDVNQTSQTFYHLINESLRRRSFFRSSLNSKLDKVLNHNLRTISDKQVDYLDETNELHCSKIDCKKTNFLKLRELTEKLAKTNDSFDALNQTNYQKCNSTRLGVSSLKIELDKKRVLDKNSKPDKSKELDKNLDQKIAMFNSKNSQLNKKFKNRFSKEVNLSLKSENIKKLDKSKLNEIDKLTNKCVKNNQLIKDENLMQQHSRIFKSLPQLNLKDKAEDSIRLTSFNFPITPITPTKNCLSLPRSFCLSPRKKLSKVTNDNLHKLGSFNLKTNRFKSFFKSKLTSLNQHQNENNLESASSPKRLYRQESFSDNEFVIADIIFQKTNNLSVELNEDRNEKNRNSNEMNSSKQFSEKISKKLNRQKNSSSLNTNSSTDRLVSSESPNLKFSKNEIDLIDSYDNFNSLANTLNDKELKLNQRTGNKLANKLNRLPAFFLNANHHRISRNSNNSCQSSFSSADSGHTSVPSNTSFSSSNLARSLSFNETPDLIYSRINKLKSNETNESLSSSTTNTDSLIVSYNKPNRLIDETSFSQTETEIHASKTYQMLDKSKVCKLTMFFEFLFFDI